VAYGGAQSLYGVTPDLTCLGKIIGGGLPIGAYGGRKDIMKMVAPNGPVYQAGTLAGNPVAMTAGIETLKALKDAQVYDDLETKSSFLAKNINEAANKARVDVQLNRAGSMFTIFFTKDAVTDYETASGSDTKTYAKFFHGMLSQGVYLPTSQFEAAFVSTAHTYKDIQATIVAAEKAFHFLL
jgi:glutamate-1-semialdehyde 2,1-aminomutase